MANRLTEEMVIARTKISDLSKIKRLNCWGSELVDVALLRKMPCVEVLSLSINKIDSLSDFQECKRLEELYIRQNKIRDINEVMYLQPLRKLKNLWLGENPCADFEGYRLAIIKALPQLQKLDNVQITPEELREAQRRGKTLVHPEYVPESEEEEYRYQEQYSEPESSVEPKSPPRQETTEYELEESEDTYMKEDLSEESRDNSPPRQQSPSTRSDSARRSYSPPEQDYTARRRGSYEREPSPAAKQYFDRTPPTTNNSFEEQHPNESNFRENKIVTSQSASCIKEYANGDRYVQPQTFRQNDNDVLSNHGTHDKRERYACPAASHRPPFARRPVTRNSNILSAVLCLVKELDYPSLEVVEMAVRCRMDELDE